MLSVGTGVTLLGSLFLIGLGGLLVGLVFWCNSQEALDPEQRALDAFLADPDLTDADLVAMIEDATSGRSAAR